MAGYQCPFCSMVMVIDSSTLSRYITSFSYPYNSELSNVNWEYEQKIYKCANCNRFSVQIVGRRGEIEGKLIGKYPVSSAKVYPEYIPASIRQDYEEAHLIADLSPKASATLSRRCLQGMIRDFWEIQKARLIDEINALEGKIPTDQWRVIDSVRKIGNIGAHMEKDINIIVDIDEDEAKKLLQLIEFLMKDWYINRHERQVLFQDIIGIDNAKQLQKA